MSRAGLLAPLMLVALAASACTGTVRSATRAAVPVVVDESLTAFEDPQNRQRLEQIMGTPEMQGAIRETAQALVQGALASGAHVQAQELTAALTDAVADVLARDLRDKLLPATVQGIRASLRENLTAQDLKDTMALVDSVVTRATTAAVRSVAVELPTAFAPAVRSALVDAINAPDLHAAVAGITAETTRTALLSSRDVIIDLHERAEGQGPVVQLVDRVQRMLVRTVIATFGVGSLLGGLIIVALRTFRGDSRSGPGRRDWRGPPRGDPSGPAEASRGASGSASGRGVRLDPSPTRAT
jgi:hypothetical protein